MLVELLLVYGPSFACGLHVLRTGREMFWLFLFIIAPLLAPAFYFFVVILPDLFSGRGVRSLSRGARAALDPEREYRQAKDALAETPTAGNYLRLAQALQALQRLEEARDNFRLAQSGQFADDPAALLGLAETELDLKRPAEALQALEAYRGAGHSTQGAEVALLFARALDGLGRSEEAEAPYRFAAERMAGLEAAARYIEFMARSGRKSDAALGMGELERRLKKIPAYYRAEAKRWRDYAAAALAKA